jgi:hypothetical protein
VGCIAGKVFVTKRDSKFLLDISGPVFPLLFLINKPNVNRERNVQNFKITENKQRERNSREILYPASEQASRHIPKLPTKLFIAQSSARHRDPPLGGSMPSTQVDPLCVVPN